MEHTKGGKCNKHGAYTDKQCLGGLRAAAHALLAACEQIETIEEQCRKRSIGYDPIVHGIAKAVIAQAKKD